jgi:peroxiredoxin/uncharacterized membrane protein YphA (DoxX/SURF4 family)
VSVAALLARLALAGVFLLSGVTKLRDRGGATRAARDLGLPATVAAPVGALLPFAELAVAGALLAGGTLAFAGGIASLAMLGAFTVAIAANLSLGRHPDCHCFGELSAKPLSWAAVVRNALLLAVATVVVAAGRTQPYGLGALRHRTATQLAVGTTLVLLTVAVALLAAFALQLLRRYGAVLIRLETLEAAGRGEDVRPVAPAFELDDLGGGSASLGDLVSDARPAILVFASTGCAPCQALAPAVGAWAEVAQATVVVLSSGDAGESREKFATSDALRVLHDDARVAEAFGVDRTPGAVLVTGDGRVSGGPAFGEDEIRALVAPWLPHQHVHQIETRPLGEGDPAPEVTLPAETGEQVDPARIEESAVLLFWDPHCAFAQRIADDVVAWEAGEPAVPLVVVTKGEVADVRASGLRSTLVLDPSFVAGTAFGAPGTPSAVAVHNGTLASPVAVGGPEVLDLLARTGRRESRVG